MRPREVVRALEKDGWVRHHQRGSHLYLRKEGSTIYMTVPMHNRDVRRGTLRSIIETAGISVERFIELLRA